MVTPNLQSPQLSNGYSWYVLGLLTLVQTCHSIDRALIGLVLTSIGAEFKLSDVQLGLLAGFAYGIPFALAALPFGMLVDRANRLNLLTVALSAWSVATAICGLAGGFVTLALGRAAVGAAEAAGSPTGMSILSDYFAKERRVTAIGIWYLSGGIGLAVAFTVGGLIVETYGWRWAFFAAGAQGLLLAPLLFLTVREPARGGRDLDDPYAQLPNGINIVGHIGLLASKPGMMHCLAGIVLIAAGLYGMSTWLATFLMRVHAMPVASAGLVIAIAYGVLGSLGGFVVSWLIDQGNRKSGGFDPVRTTTLGAIVPFVTAVAGVGTVALPDKSLAIVSLMICGFFSASYNGPIYAVMLTIAGPQLRGLVVSIAQLGASLVGVGAGAIVIGAVSDAIGGTRGVSWGIGVAMIVLAWGGLHLLIAAQSIKRSRIHGRLVGQH